MECMIPSHREILFDHFTIIVLLFPPKADCKSFVRTESLYGTCNTFFPTAASARALEEGKRWGK